MQRGVTKVHLRLSLCALGTSSQVLGVMGRTPGLPVSRVTSDQVSKQVPGLGTPVTMGHTDTVLPAATEPFLEWRRTSDAEW